MGDLRSIVGVLPRVVPDRKHDGPVRGTQPVVENRAKDPGAQVPTGLLAPLSCHQQPTESKLLLFNELGAHGVPKYAYFEHPKYAYFEHLGGLADSAWQAETSLPARVTL